MTREEAVLMATPPKEITLLKLNLYLIALRINKVLNKRKYDKPRYWLDSISKEMNLLLYTITLPPKLNQNKISYLVHISLKAKCAVVLIKKIKILLGILRTRTKDVNPRNTKNPFVGVDLNTYRKETHYLYTRYYNTNNIKRYEIYKDSTSSSFNIFNEQGEELIHENYYKGILNFKTWKTYDQDGRQITYDSNQGYKQIFTYNEKGHEILNINSDGKQHTTTHNKQGKTILTTYAPKRIDYHLEYYSKEDGILSLINYGTYLLDKIWKEENGNLMSGPKEITKEKAEQIIKELLTENGL